MKSLSIFAIAITVLISCLFSSETKTGSIGGQVSDAETSAPLTGANIVIIDHPLGAGSDIDGNYTIYKVPFGSYSVKVSFLGYETRILTDVIVKSGRTTNLNIQLKESVDQAEKIVVKAGYFAEAKEQPTGTITYSYEELRRAAGGGGDITRTISGLPSIAKVADNRNSLIVRGGSAIENTFFIDNIEMRNINHFPSQGGSDGAIALFNVDYVENTTFSTGGISPIYGDKLSAVMDIDFREGNRGNYEAQLDLSIVGAGGIVEGPINDGKGSFIIGGKRSYLDMIAGNVDISEGSMPEYWDAQVKAVYDITPMQKITIINFFGQDDQTLKRDEMIESEMPYYGPIKINQNIAGINWKSIWGTKGFSETSISHSLYKHDMDQYRTRDFYYDGEENLILDMESNEQEYRLRNVNFLKLNKKHKIEFGIEEKFYNYDYSTYYGEYVDEFGHETPEITIDKTENALYSSAFVNYTFQPNALLSIKPGARIAHFDYTDNISVSPRIAVSYNLTEKSTLDFTAGMYNQELPISFLSMYDEYKNLDDMSCIHAILGFSHLLREDTRLTIEAYDKEYSNMPISADNPESFPLDGMMFSLNMMPQENIESSGKAYSRGIEVTLQKKLASGFYGMVASSYSQSRYQGYDGKWYDRANDHGLVFNIEGGYKPNSKWDVSVRWSYAGGRPYTPVDMDASHEQNALVLIDSKTNSERMPDYHSLNLRVDRRFNFKNTNMILYLSLWNAYNRRNLMRYEWNEVSNELLESRQWEMLPVFGLEMEF